MKCKFCIYVLARFRLFLSHPRLANFMTPDELLRAYATRKVTPPTSSPSSGSLTHPRGQLQRQRDEDTLLTSYTRHPSRVRHSHGQRHAEHVCLQR